MLNIFDAEVTVVLWLARSPTQLTDHSFDPWPCDLSMWRSHVHAPSPAWVTCGRSSFLPKPKNVHFKLITELQVQIVVCPSKAYGSVINPGTDSKSAQEAVVENETKHLRC